MSLSDRFEEALQKSRKEMEDRGYTERLTVMRDIVTSLRQAGIAADLKPDLDRELPYPPYSVSETNSSKRFILEIDGARFGMYFGQKSKNPTQQYLADGRRDEIQYLWLTAMQLPFEADRRPSSTEYDVLTDKGRAKLEQKLLNFVAEREASRELMPGADAKSSPAKVRKTKSPVKLG